MKNYAIPDSFDAFIFRRECSSYIIVRGAFVPRCVIVKKNGGQIIEKAYLLN